MVLESGRKEVKGYSELYQTMHNFLLPCASQAGTSLVTTLIGINNGKFKPLKNPTLCNVFISDNFDALTVHLPPTWGDTLEITSDIVQFNLRPKKGPVCQTTTGKWPLPTTSTSQDNFDAVYGFFKSNFVWRIFLYFSDVLCWKPSKNGIRLDHRVIQYKCRVWPGFTEPAFGGSMSADRPC